MHRRRYSRVCLRHKSLLIISIDRSPFVIIISDVNCACVLQRVVYRFGYGLVTYLCSFDKCRVAQCGFQTVMQNGVSFCLSIANCFWPRSLFGFSPGVPIRHAERRCRTLYTICCGRFFFVAGAFRGCSRSRLVCRAGAPAAPAVFVLHLAEFLLASRMPCSCRPSPRSAAANSRTVF